MTLIAIDEGNGVSGQRLCHLQFETKSEHSVGGGRRVSMVTITPLRVLNLVQLALVGRLLLVGNTLRQRPNTVATHNQRTLLSNDPTQLGDDGRSVHTAALSTMLSEKRYERFW